jgi:hypothetical protein
MDTQFKPVYPSPFASLACQSLTPMAFHLCISEVLGIFTAIFVIFVMLHHLLSKGLVVHEVVTHRVISAPFFKAMSKYTESTSLGT